MRLFIFFLALYIGVNAFSIPVICGILLLTLLVFAYKRFQRKRLLTIGLVTFLAGVGMFLSNSYRIFDIQKSEYKSIVSEVKDNYFLVNSGLEKFYVYEKDNQKEVGDILLIKGKKSPINFEVLESSFDFNSYLNKKGVHYELKADSILVLFSNPIKINSYKKNFLSKFDEHSRSLVKSILFASYEDGEVTGLLSSLHLVRLLSSSGIYLFLLSKFLTFLFSFFLKEKWAKGTSIFLLLVYGVFTYPKFIVIKFLALAILRWINDYLLKKKFKYLEIVSFLGIILLFINPYLGLGDSFFLSFYIPIFIYFFNASFSNLKKRRKRLFSLISIQIIFVPFILSYYHEISPLAPLFQTFFLPLTVILFILSMTSLIGIPIYNGISSFSFGLERIFKTFSPLLIKIYAPMMDIHVAFIYEVVFLLLIYFLSIRFKPIYKVILTGLITISTLYLVPIKNFVLASISFINVGQGDATLINVGSTTVLIDTGGSYKMDIATDVLIPYLKKERIYDIDLLITTHEDFDHSGGVYSLTHNFKVKQYVTDYKVFPIKIGNMTITNYNIYPELWKEDNDKSLVLGFNLMNTSVLVMGDAPKKIENKIIENSSLSCDILKVGHHGSNTSSGDSFIKAISPKVAIISCGRNNRYGHPHKEVINILNKYHVQIRRTDIEGTIKYSFFKP